MVYQPVRPRSTIKSHIVWFGLVQVVLEPLTLAIGESCAPNKDWSQAHEYIMDFWQVEPVVKALVTLDGYLTLWYKLPW